MFKICKKREEPYMGELGIYKGLDNPLESMLSCLSHISL